MNEEAKILLSTLAKINDPCDTPECSLWFHGATGSTIAIKIPRDDVNCQTMLRDLVLTLIQRQLAEADNIRSQLAAITEDPTVRG